jgi:fermentation-respiration switch protein FrsA (DUF1100 family)
MDTSRADVEFESCGASLRGWLFRNPDHAMAPGVVMAHGFTAVKEMFLEEYANAFCAAGFTVLVYDHHGFGASEGQPRQSPTPSVQLQGYRDAVHWLGQQSAVDRNRIAIWGSSFSGGHVAILAGEELSIRCAVAQVPGIVSGGPALSEATLAAMSAALTEGRLDDTLPAASATSDGLGIMYADGAYNWFSRVARERAPLLLIVAPDDVLTPPGPAVEIASGISLIDVVEIPGGHFDAYESGFSLSSSSAVSWFKRYL